MTERLLLPQEAAESVAQKIRAGWAAAVCAETQGLDPDLMTVRLRPGVTSGAAAARLGFGTWHDWVQAWRSVASAGLPGVDVETSRMSVERVPDEVPSTLRVSGLDAAVALVRYLGGEPPRLELEGARRAAGLLHGAGAVLTPATLRRVCKLPGPDVETLVAALTWLADHPDLSGWTARQLPVPGMHSKWLEANGQLLREVAGRDVLREVRHRLAVVHLTYVDPDYLATGRRRHDAWTTGDVHDLAYRPRIVLVVENRDSRLWFPSADGVLVVEGGGKAAAALLAEIPWVRDAEHIAYWGDIDADGFAILDHFRRSLAVPASDGAPGRDVASILMDAAAAQRYAYLGVSTDKDGQPIPPSSVHLAALTVHETAAYHVVATAGPTRFRRIEQERVPSVDARAALLAVAAAQVSD